MTVKSTTPAAKSSSRARNGRSRPIQSFMVSVTAWPMPTARSTQKKFFLNPARSRRK